MIIIPPDMKPYPSTREVSAAIILANYFQKKVYFIKRSNHKTPDFMIGKLLWELKTPTGKGKYNLQHALRNAIEQSENVIIDARYSKMHIARIRNELDYQLQRTRQIKRLLLIEKSGKIVDIKKKRCIIIDNKARQAALDCAGSEL